MATMTIQQRREREVLIAKYLEDGLSLSQIARELGVSQQSVHKFLTVRGWRTAEMQVRSGINGTGARSSAETAKKKAARKAMKPDAVDRSGV